MKFKNEVIFFCLICVPILLGTLGCNEDNMNNGAFAVNGGGTNQTSITNVPISFAGTTMSQTVTSSTGTNMPTSGIFTTQFTGVPGATSGDFQTFEITPLPGTAGTFASSVTSQNTSTILFQDPTLGLAMAEELTFNSPSSGTFVRNIGSTASQSGTFTIANQ